MQKCSTKLKLYQKFKVKSILQNVLYILVVIMKKGGAVVFERIRNLREDHDLKQEDIAIILHCSQACYSNYENGRRDIPSEVWKILADYYGVSVDYLMGRTNRKDPYPTK